MATVLHPYYRTNWLNKVMQILRVPAKEQKAKRDWLKKIWLVFAAKHQDSSYDGQTGSKNNVEKGKQKERGQGNTRKRRTTAQIAKEL